MPWIANEGAPLDGNARFAITLWSNEPNDLEGIVFVVEKLGISDEMTAEKWAAYLEASDKWWDRYHVVAEKGVRSGELKTIDTTVKAPPPPPKKAEVAPPRPSKNARWIPGYWHYEGGSFHWLSGFWRVPKTDISAGLTARAPRPPPAARRRDPRPPRPARNAVWAPGYWQWNGRAYIWVKGAWRIPPSAQSDWKPAQWIVNGVGEAVFSPGGWTIHVDL